MGVSIGGVSIGYLVHDVHDAAVHRRAAMMRAGGGEVRIGGFRRAAVADAGTVDLGRTRDRRWLHRAGSVARHLVNRRTVRRVAAGADVLVARNLESLALAAAVRAPGQRLAYECLDLHQLLLGNGAAARGVRRIEAALLAQCDLVVTSSPAYRHHFRARQGYAGPILLAENKVWDARPPAARGGRAAPWRIAWAGVLRCRRSLHLLAALADAAAGAVEVILAGRVAHASVPDFDAVVAASPFLRYTGSYAPADLPALYREADFAWAIDYYEAGLNSRWLLPNRLYESLAFGAVPIALADTETAAWLARAGVGLSVRDPLAELAPLFASLTPGDVARLSAAAAALPRSCLVADETDARALVGALVGAPAE